MSDVTGTIWGYSISGASLPDILTVVDFNIITGRRYTGDARIDPGIKAAQNAVRNYCGWHLAPSLTCFYESRVLYGNDRLKRVGPDLLIQLPAAVITGIESVIIDEIELEAGWGDQAGYIHAFDVPPLTRKSLVQVEYTAGLPDADAAIIREIIADMVTHALASSYGVTSEAAGGMSITYNSSWVTANTANALSESAKESLEVYRLKGVF